MNIMQAIPVRQLDGGRAHRVDRRLRPCQIPQREEPLQLQSPNSTVHQKSKRKRMSLFTLPPELWVYICELVMIPEGPIKAFSSLSLKRNEKCVMQPGITRTCRVIREQTLRLFYENTTFIAYDQNALPFQLVSWLAAIGWTNRARLKRLHIKRAEPETLERIDEYCVEMGITLPFRMEYKDVVTGKLVDQLSFVDGEKPDDHQRLQEDLDILRLANTAPNTSSDSSD